MSRKYYERVLRSSNVISKEFRSEFGASILKKYGWEDGVGLGAVGQGLAAPIQIRRRQELAGLGTSNKGTEAQWTNWWDTLFNDTARKVRSNDGLNPITQTPGQISSSESSDADSSDAESFQGRSITAASISKGRRSLIAKIKVKREARRKKAVASNKVLPKNVEKIFGRLKPLKTFKSTFELKKMLLTAT